MVTLEIISVFVSAFFGLLPYLNLGIMITTINLYREKTKRFIITPKEYKKHPWENLVWSFIFAFLNWSFSVLVQTYLEAFGELLSLILLLLLTCAYYEVTQMKG